MKSEDLIIRCQKGEAKAQDTLYDLFANSMYTLCYRYLKDQFDAEDVLIKGFYKVFKNINSFQYTNDQMLKAWIKKIMVNECLMLLRKGNNFNLIPISEELDLIADGDLDQNLSSDTFYELLMALPNNYRTVFNMYVLEGFSHKEIAEQLNISPEVSRSQLSKAKALLRTLVKKNDMKYAI